MHVLLVLGLPRLAGERAASLAGGGGGVRGSKHGSGEKERDESIASMNNVCGSGC
jgi:hypothetical protein